MIAICEDKAAHLVCFINDGLEIYCRETDGPCLTLGNDTGRKLNDAAVALLEAALPTLESQRDFDISGFEFTTDSGEHDLERLIKVLHRDGPADARHILCLKALLDMW